MTYQTYRLCRDKETIRRIRDEEKQYSLPHSVLTTGIDLFTFINQIIKDCKSDYALICHDDVILPETIDTNVANCINSVNNYIGEENWGVIGNAGVEYLSKNIHTLLSDPHTTYLPPKYKNPVIAESLDGNTLLLNIKSLREKEISLPKEIKGYHLYDLILCSESYKKGLACLISPWLYVIHSSSGNYKAFKKAIKEKDIQNYFRESFSNHTITSINDNIPIFQDYEDLSSRKRTKKSFETIVDNLIKDIFKEKSGRLNIIVRMHRESSKIIRLLRSINTLQSDLPKNIQINVVLSINNISKKEITPFVQRIKKEFSTISITDIYLDNTNGRYPRVAALVNAVNHCYSINPNSYSWIVDYDDFVFPDIAKHLPYLLYKNEIIIGNSVVFNEKWDNLSEIPMKSKVQETYSSNLAEEIITGNNFLPICSVIYKTEILKDVFESSKLQGDYYEDYAISLLTIPHYDNISTKISFAGISYHGGNTVLKEDRTHWNYSYVTFLSEIINKGVLDKNTYQHLLTNNRHLLTHIAISNEFKGFKKGKIWKMLTIYRKLKRKLRHFIDRYTKGRGENR